MAIGPGANKFVLITAALVAIAVLPGAARAQSGDQSADLRLSMEAWPEGSTEVIDVGETFRYGVTVRNQGAWTTAANVQVIDELPEQLEFVAVELVNGAGSCEFQAPARVICNIPELDPGFSSFGYIEIAVRRLSEAEIWNTASVTAATSDPNAADNSDTVVIPAWRVAGLRCGGSTPTLVGTEGDDWLFGEVPSVIHGFAGNDRIDGSVYYDALCGGAGADVIYGRKTADLLSGGSSGDALQGDNGYDELFGNRGNDSIYGEDGDDIMNGGPGVDRCVGGPGRDVRRGCEKG